MSVCIVERGLILGMEKIIGCCRSCLMDKGKSAEYKGRGDRQYARHCWRTRELFVSIMFGCADGKERRTIIRVLEGCVRIDRGRSWNDLLLSAQALTNSMFDRYVVNLSIQRVLSQCPSF